MRPRKPISAKARQQIERILAQARTVEEFKRIQCVWLRAAFDLSVAQIARAVGLSEASVRCFHSRYLRHGIAVLQSRSRGGRRHQNLSLEQEQQLLSQFLPEAERGGMLEVSHVQAGYEEMVGHAVPKSTVYRLLARHGWRKLAPRPRHPHSDQQLQQRFKKNSPGS